MEREKVMGGRKRKINLRRGWGGQGREENVGGNGKGQGGYGRGWRTGRDERMKVKKEEKRKEENMEQEEKKLE